MLTEVRDILNKIDDILVKDDQASQQLWDVLSALRGPDNGSATEKTPTTCVLRGKAFPKTLTRSMSNFQENIGGTHGALYERDRPGFAEDRRKIFYDYRKGHFEQHTRRAFLALGLSWETSNDRQ